MRLYNQLLSLLLLPTLALAQPGFVANYDEAAMPACTLPGLLTMPNGKPVTSA